MPNLNGEYINIKIDDCKSDRSQHDNNQKLCYGSQEPPLELKEGQWKSRQHDQNFPMEAKPVQKKYYD